MGETICATAFICHIQEKISVMGVTRGPSLQELCSISHVRVVFCRYRVPALAILSYAYEHTCTFGLFMLYRRNLKLKSIQPSAPDERFVRRQE
jgi:hypothetical protein